MTSSKSSKPNNHHNFCGSVGFMRQVALRIYALLFLVELILRVLAEGCPFFWSSPNVLWNYLDTRGSRLVGAFCPHGFCFCFRTLRTKVPRFTWFHSRPILGVKKTGSLRGIHFIIEVVPPPAEPRSVKPASVGCSPAQNANGILAFLGESRLFYTHPRNTKSIQA